MPLTGKQIHQIYGIGKSTLLKWEKQGLLTPRKTPRGIRRYKKEDIEDILKTPSGDLEPLTSSITDNNTNRLLTAKEIARFLNLSHTTIYKMSRLKTIPCVRLPNKILRFRLSDINRWLQERTDLTALKKPR